MFIKNAIHNAIRHWKDYNKVKNVLYADIDIGQNKYGGQLFSYFQQGSDAKL